MHSSDGRGCASYQRAGRATALAVVALLLGAPTGCVSRATYAGWKNSGHPTAIQIRTSEATPSHVQLAWRAMAELPYSPEVLLNFDPDLHRCDEVDVLVASAEAPTPVVAGGVTLRGFDTPAADVPGPIWKTLEDPDCTVLAVVGEVFGKADGPRLVVSTFGGPIGTVKLETRRNPWWIPLIPLGLVSDLAIVPTGLIALSCLATFENNLCILMGLQVLDARY